ncbi:MAG: 30S ribosomal protein S6 [Candidatus Spechtbacterales bacterium]
MEETATKIKHLYDLHMLISPSSVDADISNVEQKLNDIIQGHGGVIERADKFTKRTLAYPIKNHVYAYGSDIYFRIEPSAIDEITAELKISGLEILRFMILKDDQESRSKKPKKKRREKPVRTKEKVTTKQKDEEIEKVVEGEKTTATAEKDSVKTKKKKTKEKSETETDEDKMTLDDIDKRLDEIMENL